MITSVQLAGSAESYKELTKEKDHVLQTQHSIKLIRDTIDTCFYTNVQNGQFSCGVLFEINTMTYHILEILIKLHYRSSVIVFKS